MNSFNSRVPCDGLHLVAVSFVAYLIMRRQQVTVQEVARKRNALPEENLLGYSPCTHQRILRSPAPPRTPEIPKKSK
eukprot:5920278-Amphidinium_carterae.1